MNADQVSSMYVQQAKQLESQSKYKEAERLYVTVNEPDLAIAMYKSKKMWNDMIRLVKIHYKEMAQESHLVVARVSVGLLSVTNTLHGVSIYSKSILCTVRYSLLMLNVKN